MDRKETLLPRGWERTKGQNLATFGKSIDKRDDATWMNCVKVHSPF
jgi:hypothetical protein